MRILAFDLGTNTGWAILNDDGQLNAGTKTLATGAEITAWGKSRLNRRQDPRILRFFKFVHSLVVSVQPDVVVFEDVTFSTYTLQTQMWSSLRAALWLAISPSILLECLPVSSLKMFATGSGAATKQMMMSALFKQHPEMAGKVDDNGADAAWLAIWASKILCRIKT